MLGPSLQSNAQRRERYVKVINKIKFQTLWWLGLEGVNINNVESHVFIVVSKSESLKFYERNCCCIMLDQRVSLS